MTTQSIVIYAEDERGHGGPMKNNESKEERSWVKLKAFLTNVRRPNNKDSTSYCQFCQSFFILRNQFSGPGNFSKTFVFDNITKVSVAQIHILI